MLPATRSNPCWAAARWGSSTWRDSVSPERRVALKLITPAFANDEVFRRRFLREATAAAAIEHPHILPVYAAGESNGTLFMAMRLIDGRDLREILRGIGRAPARAGRADRRAGRRSARCRARSRPYPSGREARERIGERAARRGGRRLLLPHGLRHQHLDRVLGSDDHSDGPDGRDGELHGARADRGRSVSMDSADLYSLGCVLYECLTGQRTVQRSERARDPVRPSPRAGAGPELHPPGPPVRAWTRSRPRAQEDAGGALHLVPRVDDRTFEQRWPVRDRDAGPRSRPAQPTETFPGFRSRQRGTERSPPVATAVQRGSRRPS